MNITGISIEPRFPRGKIVATPGALALMKEHRIDPLQLLSRHVRRDWGDLTEEDRQEDELSVTEGFRTLSAYGQGNQRLWVITEAGRSVTITWWRTSTKLVSGSLLRGSRVWCGIIKPL